MKDPFLFAREILFAGCFCIEFINKINLCPEFIFHLKIQSWWQTDCTCSTYIIKVVFSIKRKTSNHWYTLFFFRTSCYDLTFFRPERARNLIKVFLYKGFVVCELSTGFTPFKYRGSSTVAATEIGHYYVGIKVKMKGSIATCKTIIVDVAKPTRMYVQVI